MWHTADDGDDGGGGGATMMMMEMAKTTIDVLWMMN